MKRASPSDKDKVDLTDVRKHILEGYPNEIVGVIINSKYHRLNNISDNPENSFKVDPQEWMAIQALGEVEFLIHSHTYDPEKPREHQMNPATPSTADWKTQQRMNIPWAVFATEGENVTPPVLFPMERDVDLIGRDFAFYASDCFTIVADYYHQTYGIELPPHPDGIEWERGVEDGIYMKHAKAYGFEEVPVEDLKEGDVVVMSIRGELNHGGIYIGDGMLLHHLSGRKSERIPLTKMNSFIRNVVRYTGNVKTD